MAAIYFEIYVLIISFLPLGGHCLQYDKPSGCAIEDLQGSAGKQHQAAGAEQRVAKQLAIGRGDGHNAEIWATPRERTSISWRWGGQGQGAVLYIAARFLADYSRHVNAIMDTPRANQIEGLI